MVLIAGLFQLWLIVAAILIAVMLPIFLLRTLAAGIGEVASDFRPSPRVNWSRTDSRPAPPPTPKPQRVVFWWIGRDQGPGAI